MENILFDLSAVNEILHMKNTVGWRYLNGYGLTERFLKTLNPKIIQKTFGTENKVITDADIQVLFENYLNEINDSNNKLKQILSDTLNIR